MNIGKVKRISGVYLRIKKSYHKFDIHNGNIDKGFVNTNKLILQYCIASDQIRSVAQSCLTLCNPMNRSTPGLIWNMYIPYMKYNMALNLLGLMFSSIKISSFTFNLNFFFLRIIYFP